MRFFFVVVVLRVFFLGRSSRERFSRGGRGRAFVGTFRGNSENIFLGKVNVGICFSCLNYMCYLFFKWFVIIGEWGRYAVL